MQDLFLAVNAGSSSLKLAIYQLGDHKNFTLLLSSAFSNLSTEKPTFDFKPVDSKFAGATTKDAPVSASDSSHKAAFNYFLDFLRKKCGIDTNRIGFIAHRVVHGGSFPSPTMISSDTFSRIEELSDLAPL